MAPFRTCGMEALDIDLSPPGDPRAHAGSNDVLHDLRQGLVSPSTRPQTIGRQQIQRASRISGSMHPNVPLRRVGATRAKRPRPALHRSQSRPSAAGDIPQALPSRSQLTSTSSLAHPDYMKLSRRQLFIELLQLLCCLPIYRENTLPRLSSVPFGNAQEAPKQSLPGLQPICEGGLNLQSASLGKHPPPSAGEQSTTPQISSNSQPTKQTAPPTRRQLLADPSQHAAVSYSRKQTSDQPGGELDSLTEATERLRLKEQADPTGNSSFLAALHRKFHKDATGESIEIMVRSIVQEFRHLKASGQGKLKNEAPSEQGSKHAISTVPKQAAALRRKISIVQGLVGFLGRSNSKVLKYDLILRKLKQQATELVEQHQQHAVTRREEHERDLRQMMTRLRNLQGNLYSITKEAERELMKSEVKQARLNKRKHG